VLIGQLLVAACFAELAARYPISGAIYQWSTRLSNLTFGWFAGWIMVIGQIVVVAAAALALQMVLPPIWSGFQLVAPIPHPSRPRARRMRPYSGGPAGPHHARQRARQPDHVAHQPGRCHRRNHRGVLIVVLLFTHSERTPGITFHTGGTEAGLVGALLVGSLTAAYVMIGFDSAAR